MLPFDIHYPRERYDDMLAAAEERRLAKIAQSIARLENPPKRDKSLIVRVLEALRPRRAARAH